MSGLGTPDFFYREAQRLGYVARSAFKLLQIQKQHKLIKPGSSVLDLGCAPGAWLQVACQNLGPLQKGGTVVGVDLKKVKIPSLLCDERVKTICADVTTLGRNQITALSPQGMGFSVILSDMCPIVSGIATKDAALSIELGMTALSLAIGKVDLPDSDNNSEADLSETTTNLNDPGVLQRGGHLVIKFLESEDTRGFNEICKQRFKNRLG